MNNHYSAFFYKHYHIMRKTPAELSWIFVYPLISLFSIGILTHFIKSLSNQDVAGYILIGTFVWTFYSLVQRAMTYGIMFDIWSGCIVHIIIAPRLITSFIVGNALYGVFSALVTLLFTSIIAYFVFGFNLFATSWVLPAALFVIIIYAISEGLLIDSFILAFGYEFMALIWQLVGIVMIISGVYYPIDLFPWWLKICSLALPHTHVLIALRAALYPETLGGYTIAWPHLMYGLGLSLVYLSVTIYLFKKALYYSRMSGKVTDL